MANYVESFAAKMDWGKPFQRTGKFPLDRSQLFSTYDDAVKYAKADASDPDSRGLYGAAYIGQIITVYENDVITVYKIEADRTLSEVGRATDGDGKSISLTDGVLSLFGFENATAGQQMRVVNVGTEENPDLQLEWYSPDTSTVEGLQSAVGALQDTVGDATKGLVKDVDDLQNEVTAINGKLTGALHYKGSCAFAELPADDNTTGDVWNVTDAGGVDAHGNEIHAGDNVIWNGTGWDVSTGTIDLSSYYTSTQVDTIKSDLEDKIEEVAGAATKVTASKTNGNIVVDDQEVNVYTLPTATADTVGGVKSVDTQDGVTIAADGTMSVNDISASKVKGTVSAADKVTNGLTIGDKTFDGSAAINITADDVPIPTDVVRKTDVAGEDSVGVVKATAAQDGVSVAEDGTMSVNDISASKVQGVVSEAAKVSHKVTAGAKSFDGSADVEITAEDLDAVKTATLDDYVKKTQIGTADVAGLVKSSATQDTVAIGTDGTMTVNDISASKVQGTVSAAADAEKLGGVAATDILNGTDGQVKSAAAADKLADAHNIALTGDATGTASFDGSADASIAVTLADTGVAAGTYTKVTTDSKGRVTAGAQLAVTDIPDLTLAKITDAGDLAAKDEVARADIDASFEEDIADLETKAHTHENKAVLDGITASKVSNWDDAASKIDLKANAADVYVKSDVYTQSETDAKISAAIAGAYHFCGSYDTLAELEAAVTAGTITPAAGDVYNIATAGGTDMNGNAVKAGDNVAYVDNASGTGWDILGGTMDLSGYATNDALTTGLAAKAEKTVVDGINDRLGTAETEIDTLQETVGDHADTLTDHETRIGDLETTVGDASKGLVKAVADNTTVITKLDADADTTGSVRQLIAASASDINAAINDITKDGGTIDTKVEAAVTAHNEATDAHADLFAAKQNKAIQATITFDVSDFVENDENNGPAYKATKTVDGLDTAKAYASSIAPTIESCAAVVAAQFYPMTSVSDGALTVYCVNTPTAAIVVSGTFTEIQ